MIYYQYNKKDYYKLQCSELTKKQFKNVNQTSIKKYILKKKVSIHKKLCKHKAKSINQYNTELEHNVLSINAEGVKMEKY